LEKEGTLGPEIKLGPIGLVGVAGVVFAVGEGKGARAGSGVEVCKSNAGFGPELAVWTDKPSAFCK